LGILALLGISAFTSIDFYMFKLINKLSLKHKLFIAFFVFTCIIILVAGISFWFYVQRDRLVQVSQNMEGTLVSVLQLVKTEQEFFNNELSNNLFYRHGRSLYLDRHDAQHDSIQANLQQFINQNTAYNFDVRKDLQQLSEELQAYKQNFREVVTLTRLRGFKDKGLEGQMRKVIHEIEASGQVPMLYVLSIRRHEKDYIIRKDIEYVVKLEQAVGEAQQQVLSNGALSRAAKEASYKQLEDYKRLFRELLAFERAIGYDGTKQGFKYQMRSHSDNAINIIKKTSRKAFQRSSEMAGDFQNIFIIVVLIVVVLSLTFSYFLSFFITIPVVKLSQVMQEAVEEQFKKKIPQMKIYAEDEVGELTKDFNIMIVAIQKQLDEIKQNNAVILERNEELETINQQVRQSEKRLESLLKVKEKFFSIISHDLRSPLNTLKGFLNILHTYTESFSAQELRQLSGDMQDSLNRVMGMLDDLLRWSRSQTGDLEYAPQVLPLSKIVEENIALLQQTAQAKSIRLEAEVSPQIWVKADKNMVDFILRNLISNAIKFTYEQGLIRVSASANEYFTSISVEDNGMGISPEILQRLFDPETHLTTMGTHKEKGTGFGLLMCKDFVEKNEGTIRIESQVDKGTKVIFSLQSIQKYQET
jgi:signal transduction histidine kinase